MEALEGLYVVPEDELGMGASLGNSSLWIHTKGNGAIERIFLNEVGASLVGTVALRYGTHARPIADPAIAYSPLYHDPGSGVFEIHPAFQRRRLRLASVLDVAETTFLPLGAGDPGHDDAPAAYVMVEIVNRDEIAHHLRVVGSALLRGSTPADIRVRYDAGSGALVAWNASKPDWVRVLAFTEPASRHGADFDLGGSYDASHLHPASNRTDAQGDIIGRLQLDLTLAPGEQRTFCLRIGLYACGDAEAVRCFSSLDPAQDVFDRSVVHLNEVLDRARVLTPDATINSGALWSKVNMRRVMACYPTGCAFTNDPGTYANVVVRDCAWFIFGNDHFMPEFSRDILDNISSRQYENGKLPEYFDGVSGRVEDDGLNINDDTALYILAVNHHFRASGDLDWLKRAYPAVAKAARYIMAQIDDRGLVFCTANDPRGDVWAIAGWRNIIPGYTINGAVTEINAECVAALRAASHLADNIGGPDADKSDFAAASARVRAAMDEHLINPDNGLYYLNIDVNGNAHTDVTGDEIFPVMMRACSEETGFRVISRLNCPDFWTPAGLRTASREDPRFDPSACSGLLGGVWPGLTWWYAFGAARYHPDIMVRALGSSFEHYGADPKRNNTVPGQFSEWFDGESLENRGMRLSPWEPPRFLWAAVEGVCGLMLSPSAPRINPLIPPHWRWGGVRNLPYHGAYFTYFVVRGSSGFRIFSTLPVDSDWDVELYDRDVSDHVRIYAPSAVVIALARENGLAILIGNTSSSTVHAPITIDASVASETKYYLRDYNSERGDWEDGGEVMAADIHDLTMFVDAGGFRLIELSREAPSGAP